MSLAEYLQFLDWTGRQVKPGKRGSVPKTAPPILERLNLSVELWLQVIEQFGRRRSANRVTPARQLWQIWMADLDGRFGWQIWMADLDGPDFDLPRF